MPSHESHGKSFDLGDGSSLFYLENFLDPELAHMYLENLNNKLPWTRPTLSIFGRKCEQPRETCYVANEGLPCYKYSGYEPTVHKWEDFKDLKSIFDLVHEALPGCSFNSVLVNRYVDGNNYAGWHADDEKLYGSTPTIASVTLGAKRDFLIRRKKNKRPKENLINVQQSRKMSTYDEPLANESTNKTKRKLSCGSSSGLVDNSPRDLHTLSLQHGSMLVMRGYTQRDWEHSIPRRKRVNELRINLTFRYIEVSEAKTT